MRYSWRIVGLEVIVGLEWKRHEESTHEIRKAVRTVIGDLMTKCQDTDPESLVYAVSNALQKHWPYRAYFIEVGDEDEWVQVFDPKDFVKERCDCPCRVNE